MFEVLTTSCYACCLQMLPISGASVDCFVLLYRSFVISHSPVYHVLVLECFCPCPVYLVLVLAWPWCQSLIKKGIFLDKCHSPSSLCSSHLIVSGHICNSLIHFSWAVASFYIDVCLIHLGSIFWSILCSTTLVNFQGKSVWSYLVFGFW